MATCLQCNSPVDDASSFCSRCGSPQGSRVNVASATSGAPIPPIVIQCGRRSTKPYWIAISILAFFLFANLVGALIRRAARPGKAGSVYQFSEDVLRPSSARKKVVEIKVLNVISFAARESVLFEKESMAEHVINEIRAAANDSSVLGIVLVVDSPGGSVTASDSIFNELQQFQKSGSGRRKVVAFMRDIAASGGYYVSLAADRIVAHPTALTGSIGVVLNTVNVKGLADKLGIRDVTIKSGQKKDLLNPLREMSADERSILQTAIDEVHDRFVSLVAVRRHLDKAVVKKLADGRIYTASQARNLKLVDWLGDENQAIDLLGNLIGEKQFKLVRYRRDFSLGDLLSAKLANLPRGFSLPWTQAQDDIPRLEYRWSPGLMPTP